MKSITEIVKDNKQVYFVKYRQNYLYYKTECGFEFPVPLEDIGDATVNNTEKALLMMRYIRAHHDFISKNKGD